MTKILVPANTKIGDEFNARIDILTKIGSVFSIFSSSNGERIGSARVVKDHHRSGEYVSQPYSDPRRENPLPESNMGDHCFGFRVERTSRDEG